VVIVRGSRLITAAVCGAMLAAVSLPVASASPAAPTASGTFSELSGVYCTSEVSCWAVGNTGNINSTKNEILRWNGRKWHAVSVPNPAGTSAQKMNELSAVRCLTVTDCSAVGTVSRNDTTSLAEVLHWNGKHWSKQSVPQPGGAKTWDITTLLDSTCASARNCWAVGAYGFDNGATIRVSNLILHWNGKRWSKVSGVPNPVSASTRFNLLSAVRCLSATDCVADGQDTKTTTTGSLTSNQALHWNGKKWSVQSTPNPAGTALGDFSELRGLGCSSSTSCWGVGADGNNESPTQKTLNEILHWNGKKWTRSAVPNPGGSAVGAFNQLNGATCSSTKNCWAVGTYANSAGARVNEALHWNGKKWSVAKTPDLAGTAMSDSNTLKSVRCTSASNCWAVGSAQKSGQALQNEILHWNGKKWAIVR
jgi:hypothetical protein